MKQGERLIDLMLKNNIIEPDETDVYCFGLRLLSETVVSFIIFTIIAFMLGILSEFIVFILSFAILRQYAGGFHAKTFMRCLLISCLIVVLLYIPLHFTGDGTFFICIGSALSLPVIAVLSPVDSVYKPIAEDERKKYKKRLLILLSIEVMAAVFVYFLVNNAFTVCIVYSWCVLAASLIAGKIHNKIMKR